MQAEGILFVGDDGAIMADFLGQDPKLFAKGKVTPLQIPNTLHQSQNRSKSWTNALVENTQSPGSFLNAGAITDTVNLGTVALRAGKKILFDNKNTQITNAPDAQKYLYRDYREGWQQRWRVRRR